MSLKCTEVLIRMNNIQKIITDYIKQTWREACISQGTLQQLNVLDFAETCPPWNSELQTVILILIHLTTLPFFPQLSINVHTTAKIGLDAMFFKSTY